MKKYLVKLRSIVLVHPDFNDCIDNEARVLTVRAEESHNKKSHEQQQPQDNANERKFIFDSCSILRKTDFSEDSVFMKQVRIHV